MREVVFNSEVGGDVADDLISDGSALGMSRVLDDLREEIRNDESIAMKSAMLIKLLEVCNILQKK